MCGRYILRMQDKYLREWNLHGPPAWVTASYNIAPTQQVPIMRMENGAPAAAMVRWGLIPQRCIQPASGFYEWHLDSQGRKTPYLITLADQELFGFAGLWDWSVREDGAVIESCAHITMPANDLLADIHNGGDHARRMPAILRREDHQAWLKGTIAEARAVLQPYPADLMVARPVSTRVNSVRNNGPELIEPIAA
jgi:putative SOS response-associated peptidase YedK